VKAFRLILGFCLSAPAAVGFANITGSDLQNFNATTNGLDFVTVQSSETLGKGIFNLGLFANYAVNTLPRYEDASGRDTDINDSIIAADINFGMGLASFWDIGISIPSVIYQDVNFDGDRGQFDKNGVTEIRANSKWRLYGDRDGGIAFILGTNVNVTENNPYTGSGSGPTMNFEFAFDTTFNRIAVGANIGYRKRSPGERVSGFPIEPLQDQYIGSLAASYLFTSIDTKMIFELYAGMPTKKTETVKSRSTSAAEMLLGIKHDITDALAFHAGLGTEAGNGTASADWRVYSGLNYVFGGEGDKKAPQIVAAPKPKASPPAMIPKFVQNPEPGPAEPAGEGDEVFVLRGINFVFDSASRVLPGTREILTNLGQHLKKNAVEKVIIEGHTDSVGQEKYNYELGLQRAKVIREYLVRSEKLDPNLVEARSYGETRPVADNGNYQGRQLNRRVVFRIVYKK
jgi:outer membrane protein OmpA-like peptidoglycan-associated protein